MFASHFNLSVSKFPTICKLRKIQNSCLGQDLSHFQTSTQFSAMSHSLSWWYFNTLDHASTTFQLKIKEASHIQWKKPTLNHQLYHVNLIPSHFPLTLPQFPLISSPFHLTPPPFLVPLLSSFIPLSIRFKGDTYVVKNLLFQCASSYNHPQAYLQLNIPTPIPPKSILL